MLNNQSSNLNLQSHYTDVKNTNKSIKKRLNATVNYVKETVESSSH